ncbi:MAG: Ada metal-binding domain-containing protein [Gordonibacter sp.]
MVDGQGEEVVSSVAFMGAMLPDDDTCWAALRAHDARFDGLFFVGVRSTGIYCRAVCPAKMPKRENCTFFRSAAQAEAAGFRPCLKCRPELAPGAPLASDTDQVVQRAAAIIREHAGSCRVADISSQLGLSERQLRRLFERTFGVTPTAYRTTCRLLLAKSLLTDTDLPVTRVAYACGFSSVRRFNDAFLENYRMPPSRFRAKAAEGATRVCAGPIVLHIGYRPPYRFDLLLDFLRLRSIAGVEAVEGGAYMRTVRLSGSSYVLDPARETAPLAPDDGLLSLACEASLSQVGEVGARSRIGWIRVADDPTRNRLALTVSPELFGDLPLVVARVRRLFDADCLPAVVEAGLADFHARVPAASRIPGIRLPCSFDGFEMAVRAILGQQVTVKAAGTMAGRVAAAFGTPMQTPHAALTTAFPSPAAFCAPDAAERLGQLGVIAQRARAICTLARSLCSGEVTLKPGADLEAEARALAAIPGIGDWTVQYLLMRAYGHPDAFPATDLGVKNAFPGLKPRELARLSEAWSPWRSYAVMSLWSAPHDPAASTGEPDAVKRSLPSA